VQDLGFRVGGLELSFERTRVERERDTEQNL